MKINENEDGQTKLISKIIKNYKNLSKYQTIKISNYQISNMQDHIDQKVFKLSL